MSAHFYVYEHWRPDTNQCFYVGKGQGKRAYELKSSRNIHHKRIQEKLKRLGLDVEVRIVSTDLPESEAFALEVERIAHWRSGGVQTTNYSGGGEGGSNPSEETRRKIAAAGIGKQKHLGKRHSAATKALLAKLGTENIEIFNQYRKLGPASMSRRVICLDDGREFESASAAARHYGVAKSALIELCLGKNYRQTVGKLKFKYIEAEAA